MHNPDSGLNKALLVGAGEPSGNNDTDDIGEKDRNLFFITHYSGEEERFLLALFTGDKPFVTFFVVVLADADSDFLLMELELWMDS